MNQNENELKLKKPKTSSIVVQGVLNIIQLIDD